jgi:magnesium transporter
MMRESLARGSDKYTVDLEVHRSLRNVLDHVLTIVDRSATFRALLQNALTVHATLTTQRQNE